MAAEGLPIEVAERLTEALVVDAQWGAQFHAGQRPWGSDQEIDHAFGKRPVRWNSRIGALGPGFEDEPGLRPVGLRGEPDAQRLWSRCSPMLGGELCGPGAQVERAVGPGVEVATASQRLAPVPVPSLSHVMDDDNGEVTCALQLA